MYIKEDLIIPQVGVVKEEGLLLLYILCAYAALFIL